MEQTSPGRPLDSAAAAARRQEGYRLYKGTDQRAPMSLRAIARELGVNVSSVRHWREADRWDGPPPPADAQLRRVILDGLLKGAKALGAIVTNPKAPTNERLRAAVALADLYRRVGVGKPDEDARETLSFVDDVPAPSAPASQSGGGG